MWQQDLLQAYIRSNGKSPVVSFYFLCKCCSHFFSNFHGLYLKINCCIYCWQNLLFLFFFLKTFSIHLLSLLYLPVWNCNSLSLQSCSPFLFIFFFIFSVLIFIRLPLMLNSQFTEIVKIIIFFFFFFSLSQLLSVHFLHLHSKGCCLIS